MCLVLFCFVILCFFLGGGGSQTHTISKSCIELALKSTFAETDGSRQLVRIMSFCKGWTWIQGRAHKRFTSSLSGCTKLLLCGSACATIQCKRMPKTTHMRAHTRAHTHTQQFWAPLHQIQQGLCLLADLVEPHNSSIALPELHVEFICIWQAGQGIRVHGIRSNPQSSPHSANMLFIAAANL